MLDQDLKNQLKQVLHIKDLAERRGKIQRKGGGWTTCCPWHSEKTPSLHINVDPTRGSHCFGACGRSYDVFDWLELEGMPFPEAVEHLAQMGGIELPKGWSHGAGKPEHEADQRKREGLLDLLDEIQGFYRDQLNTPGAALARSEIASRQLPEELTADVGYAPDTWDALAQHLTGRGYSMDLMLETGIITRAKSGRPVDILRHRLVMPIHSRTGRVLSFAGRLLPGSTLPPTKDGGAPPKYLNGRESLVFSKGATLYGLHRAVSLRQSPLPWLLVEGYFDAKSLLGAKIPAVATMGTALTEAHAREIGRMAKHVVVWFDPDVAGQAATEKALPHLLAAGLRVSVMRQPGATLVSGEKLDPDVMVRRLGAEAIRAALTNPRSVFDWAAWVVPHLAATHRLARSQRQDRMVILQRVAELLAEGFPTKDLPRSVLELLCMELEVTETHLLGHMAAARKNRCQALLRTRQADSRPEAPLSPLPILDEVIWMALEMMADGDVRGIEVVRQVEPWLWEALPNSHVVMEVLENEGVPHSETAKAAMAEAAARRAKKLASGDPLMLHILVKRKVLQGRLQDLDQTLSDPFMDPLFREKIRAERFRVQVDLQGLGGGHLRKTLQEPKERAGSV